MTSALALTTEKVKEFLVSFLVYRQDEQILLTISNCFEVWQDILPVRTTVQETVRDVRARTEKFGIAR